MNKLVAVARLTRDIELKATDGGLSIATIGLAIDNGLKKDGEKDTLFVSAKAFNKTAENCAKYLAKGSMVACDISIHNNNYEDKETGKMKYGHEFILDNVKFLSSKREEDQEEKAELNNDQVNKLLDGDSPFDE